MRQNSKRILAEAPSLTLAPYVLQIPGVCIHRIGIVFQLKKPLGKNVEGLFFVEQQTGIYLLILLPKFHT
jgi:hypothetical protein